MAEGFDRMLSPILCKKIPEKLNCNLEKLHHSILKQLNSTENARQIPKRVLKSYLQQIENCNPRDPKNKWLLSKIKGLLSYLLKKRPDFHCSIVKGEIVIYEKSVSQPTKVSEKEEINFFSQPTELQPFAFLTNTDFVTIEPEDMQIQTQEEYNPSGDMFADAETLAQFSQENNSMLKSLAKKENDGEVDTKLKLLESLQQESDFLISSARADIKGNIFDDLSMSSEQLNQEFDVALEFTDKWITEIIDKISKLKATDAVVTNNNEAMNTSTSTCASVKIAPLHCEENSRIIREICAEFQKNLEKNTKPSQLKILKKVFNNNFNFH